MEIIENSCDLPALDRDSIHVWGVHVPELMSRLNDMRAVLNGREKEKAARFHRAEDEHASVASRGALRMLLSAYTGMPAAGISFTYSEHGKPHATGADVDFNVSHSGDWVVLAFGLDRRIGVDIEMIKKDADVLAIASRYFTPAETLLIEAAEKRVELFFQLWARKEAYVKACGSTLFKELSRFSVPVGDDEEQDGWTFRRLEAGSKYAAAVVTDRPVESVPCYDFGGMKWEN